jgi:hypothetical protein
MPLNDTIVRNAKPLGKSFKLLDGGGLYLLIQSNGSKLWRLAYRTNGKQKTLSFGRYPTVPVAEARTKSEAAKAVLKDGGDPSVLRKIEKQARGNSFRLVANEMIDKMNAKVVPRPPLSRRAGFWILPLRSLEIVQLPRSVRLNSSLS